MCRYNDGTSRDICPNGSFLLSILANIIPRFAKQHTTEVIDISNNTYWCFNKRIWANVNPSVTLVTDAWWFSNASTNWVIISSANGTTCSAENSYLNNFYLYHFELNLKEKKRNPNQNMKTFSKNVFKKMLPAKCPPFHPSKNALIDWHFHHLLCYMMTSSNGNIFCVTGQ